jgi:hypothetical protein
MEMGIKPVRRVVTGNDEQGRSRVVWDGPAPNAIDAPQRPGGGMLDLWVFDRTPAPLSGIRDDGHLPYDFEPPANGAHLRIVQSPPSEPGAAAPPLHPPRIREGCRRTYERGGLGMHKTETVDYAICLGKEKRLVLDDGEHLLKTGDVVVQVGAWHGWANTDVTGVTAFIMMGARWEDTWPKE